MIFFPDAFISGISNCGGDTTTLFVGSSILMNSSNAIVTRLSLALVPLSDGDVKTTLGGVSSYHPPSGEPMRAQPGRVITTAVVMRAYIRLLGVIFSLTGRTGSSESFGRTGSFGRTERTGKLTGLGGGETSYCCLLRASSWSMVSRLLLRRGTLCCPPSLPRSLSQSLNRLGRAATISRCCSVMSLYRLAS